MDGPTGQEPYRATKLWNEVILAFRTGMPLRKLRRRMRNYDDCFTGSECASWLNCYLKNNPNFGPDVTRAQTVQLLQKFLKCHVIDCVTSKTGKTEFRDDSHLYRFVQYSPIKSNKRTSLQILLRTPLSSRNVNDFKGDFGRGKCSPVVHHGPEAKKNKVKAMGFNENESLHLNRPIINDIPECHFIVKKLSVEETENLWKLLVVKRIDSILHPNKTDDFLDKKFISGRTILHNVTRVSKSGVVTLLDKTDDIPHWVISAMKCLANWPNASGSGSCLPNYPGFEKDVFKVVRDFFINPQVPLVPLEFNPLIVQLLLIFMDSLLNCGDNAITSNDYVVKDFSSCTGQKTSTPVIVNSLASKTSSQESSETAKTEFSSQRAEGQIILDDPTVMWDYPMTVCYETEFTSASPITKVVPNYTSELSLQSSRLSSHSVSSHENFGSVDTLSTISACSRVTKNSLTSLPQRKFYIDHCGFDEDIGNVKSNFSSSKHASLDNLDCSGNKYEILENHSLPVLSTLPRGYKMSSQSICENKSSITQQLKRQNYTICGFENVSNIARNVNSQPFNISPNEIYPRIHTPSIHSNDSCDNTLNATTEIWASCSDESNVVAKSLCGSQTSKPCSDNSSTSIKMCNTDDLSRISLKNHVTPAKYVNASRQMLPQRSYTKNQCHQNSSFVECFKDPEVKQKLTDIFQILLVLLPPANRRQLHLLFRMIQKILRNGRLTFDSELPTKDYLLETFVPAVFHNHQKYPFRKTTMFHLVSFMVSDCEVLFQAPTSLKEEVEIKLAEMRKGRIKYSLDDSCMLTYCELISQQQYEEQKVSLSGKALAELLESIIQDKSISEKEKKRKLKQFKINHPDVYDARFQNIHSAEVPSKAKKPLLSRFISMRM